MHTPHIQPFRYEDPAAPQAGHDALKLSTRHGSAVLALHGAHVLSWQPTGQRDVLWMSPESKPEPAAIRGGVPVCWPWFAKQGQAPTAAQHGPVRNLRWQVSAVHAASQDSIALSLVPETPGLAAAEGVPSGLNVRLDIELGVNLRQSLHTQNNSGAHFPLTQALHTYYAVSDARRVHISGLQGLSYTDRLRDLAVDTQREPFRLDQACDRTYVHPESLSVSRHYVIEDADWQRCIEIEVQGSRSVVVWNPGAAIARGMVDVPDEGWPGFFCVEATNAGADVIDLAPGESHVLTQILRVKPSAKIAQA